MAFPSLPHHPPWPSWPPLLPALQPPQHTSSPPQHAGASLQPLPSFNFTRACICRSSSDSCRWQTSKQLRWAFLSTGSWQLVITNKKVGWSVDHCLAFQQARASWARPKGGYTVYIPHQELQGTPQEVKYWTPLRSSTKILLFSSFILSSFDLPI